MSGEGFLQQDPAFATKAIHIGQEPEKWNSMAVVPPITLATTFKQDAPAQHRGYEYGRSGNPSRSVLEECLASLDNAKYGMCFSSGLGASTAIIHIFNAGDHMISVDDLYGGTYRYFSKVAARMNIETTYIDATDLKNVEEAIKPNTKLMWVETPTNPLLKVIDIKKIAQIVHKHNILLAVDNTFLTSYFQRPLELGADIAVYSLTKYMNGHSDVIMGAVTTSNEDVHNRLRFLQNALGIVPSPFDCYLINRSLKTLHLRMDGHMRNSLAVARYLEEHPLVEKVLHPGLPSHPQHELAKSQCYGHSGILSFYIKGGLEESSKFLSSLKVFTLAESLGGFESLAELPSVMTHASIPLEEREKIGVTDSLVRLSVGLESDRDLIADLDQAFKTINSFNDIKKHLCKLTQYKKMSEEGFLPQDPEFASKAIHVGQDPNRWNSAAVVPPITLSTTFKYDELGKHRGYYYGRSGNPSRDVLQECLASLDNAKYGICFSSGLGATTAVVHLLNAGDHIISVDDLYGGTHRYFCKIAAKMNIETTFVDAIDPKNVEKAIRPNTKLMWVETPTNPLLKVIDIKKIAQIVHKHNILLAVDNTFLTSYFQRPLELGADITVYSLTKYMNGHSDVIMGAVTTNNEEVNTNLRFLQKSMGVVPSPFDCFLVNRSLKTLHLRMEGHMRNSLAVARYLEKHPLVEKVLHPGLPSHPQHELAKSQCYGHSGILSFYIKGGLEESSKFLSSLKVFTLAESLGGFESLAELPSVMTHASIPLEEREKVGVKDSLLRLSVGLESEKDLIADLDQAFKAIEMK
ncbi:hypothetical protein L9F63_004139 [Diploptera punctata]|uniref:cystathionine gamma-lyase n=1 Tax=Diploptera punctata TaxID=6984 RepID=A0AAD8E7Y1_DIPPU|nr:hypothetical protein L9F63_004139 [Diploptera punctata]